MRLVKIIKLKLLKKLYEKNQYSKLTDKIIKYKLMSKPMEYIWYCPRRSCGAIVLKTSNPFLKKGNSYKCKRCLVVHKSEELMKNNKRNIKKYIDDLEKI